MADEPASPEPFSPGAFAFIFAIGGLLLLMPRQWVSAGILFAASAVLGMIYQLKRRAARGTKPAPPADSSSVQAPSSSSKP